MISKAVVTWKKSNYAKNFDLQFSVNGNSWSTVLNSTGVQGTQELNFTETTAQYARLYLTQNNKNTYRVIEFEVYGCADDNGGEPEIPAAPTNLNVEVTNSTTVTLSWQDRSDNEEKFFIDRKTGDGDFEEILSVGKNITSFIDGDLEPNTTYTFRVRTFNTSGYSDYSNKDSATTPDESIKPGGNIALDKPVHASSYKAGKTPENANDGDEGTYWRSRKVGSDPTHWLRIDLGRVQEFSNGVVIWKSKYYASEYAIQISNNDSDWSTVYQTIHGDKGEQEFAFAPVAARYIRLLMMDNNKSTYRINEFQIFATSSLTKKRAKNSASVTVPQETGLTPNYPNPFNPTTSIDYALSHQVHVTLRIFDLLGREVATLVNATLPAGRYQAQWNAGNVESGVYFYHLQAGDFVQTKKMTLLK